MLKIDPYYQRRTTSAAGFDMDQTAKKLGTMTIGEFDRLVEDAPEGVEYELVDGTLC
jgi:hypothetical protein